MVHTQVTKGPEADRFQPIRHMENVGHIIMSGQFGERRLYQNQNSARSVLGTGEALLACQGEGGN